MRDIVKAIRNRDTERKQVILGYYRERYSSWRDTKILNNDME